MNVSLKTFQADLYVLDESIRQWPGPIIVAADFNALTQLVNF